MDLTAIRQYVLDVEREYKSGDAREHAYRPALKALLETLEGNKQIHAINDPAQGEYGAPDYIVKRKGLPIGYIEAKDIDANLNKVQKTEQLQRYLKALGNLILTDYLEFRWYVDGELRDTVDLGKLSGKGKLETSDSALERVNGLLLQFLSQKPQPIGRPRVLAQRLASFAKLIREVIEKTLETDNGNGNHSSSLQSQYEGFKEVLIHDLSTADFADTYAQTVVYGLLAARENYRTAESPFSREKAAYAVPKTNPFLRKLFNYIAGPDLDKRLEWTILDLVELLRVAQMDAISREFAMFKPGEDPVVHFYETFLAEYDPKKREARGVYYTPQPVVGYIVRSVDRILKDKFGIPRGLADHEKIEWTPPGGNGEPKQFHRVQILDPAVGTGSFLYRTVQEIYRQFEGDEGSWPSYVREHLLPRLHGFELMMAPYTVAHMKLGMQLKGRTDYEFGEDERLNVYLTNTLENPFAQPPPALFAPWMAEEANAALRIKSKTPILVIIGNPPYSGHSANKGPWVIDLLKGWEQLEPGKPKQNFNPKTSYYHVDGQPLGERNPKWLQDDYVKFIRWSQWRIQLTGQGILGFITNHGYLDNPTFRGMRESLMHTFDEIHVMDLHGNDRKKEQVPEAVQQELGIGPLDKNVFDIQQGVAICLMVKHPGSTGDQPDAKVYHSELWGDRKRKYELLEAGKGANFKHTLLRPLNPDFMFVRQDSSLKQEYYSFTSIVDGIFRNSNYGVVTSRDRFVLGYQRDELSARIKSFATKPLITSQVEYSLRSTRETTLETSHDCVVQLHKNRELEDFIENILYRPFDARYIFYHKSLIRWPVYGLMRHMLRRDNLALISARSNKSPFADHFLASKNIVETKCGERTTQSYTFPLYLYPFDEDDPVTDAPGGRRPNLSEEFIADFSKRLKLQFVINGKGDLKQTFGPEDVFHYMYAVFHSPEYRTRYADFLKRDFPRLPLTTSKPLFRSLCALGEKLTRLHLMDMSAVDTNRYKLPKYPVKPTGAAPGSKETVSLDLNLHEGGGGDIVEKIRYSEPDDQHTGRVWINKHQYFEGIPPEVWEFHVGGYQPCQKWLKDRKGRELSYDDKEHYKLITAILAQTRDLMEDVDKVIGKTGGWPLKGSV